MTNTHERELLAALVTQCPAIRDTNDTLTTEVFDLARQVWMLRSRIVHPFDTVPAGDATDAMWDAVEDVAGYRRLELALKLLALLATNPDVPDPPERAAELVALAAEIGIDLADNGDAGGDIGYHHAKWAYHLSSEARQAEMRDGLVGA